MVATRLDIARRLGGLLCAAQQGGLSFADYSATTSVADGLEPLSPRKLASFFFPAGADQKSAQTEQSSKTSTSIHSRHKTTG